MTNGEKYTDQELRKEKYAHFCVSHRAPCDQCKANEGENCFLTWLSLTCDEQTEESEDVIVLKHNIEREKRVQDVALQLVARTSASVDYAFKLAEEYVCECERRDNKINDGGRDES